MFDRLNVSHKFPIFFKNLTHDGFEFIGLNDQQISLLCF